MLKNKKSTILIALFGIIIIIVILLAFFLSNNNGNSVENITNNSSNNASQLADHNKNNSNLVEDNTELDINNTVIKVPGEKIYFSAPNGWDVEKENFSTIVRQNKDCLVSICYSWPWPTSPESNLVNIIPRLGYNFTSDANSESRGIIVNSTIEVVSSQKSTINGYNCVSFTGIVKNDSNWNCHVYGYTFVVNDVELMVVGLVSAKDQDSNMISQINKLTDQIASSVRNEE